MISKKLVGLIAIAALIAFCATTWAAPKERPADVGQSFYLTNSPTLGAFDPDLVCVDGYHMASLYELKNPSEMHYDTNPVYSLILDDSGSGAPVLNGWIRSGRDASTGQNCSVWLSEHQNSMGQVVQPTFTTTVFGTWGLSSAPCNTLHYLWCISD